PVKDWTDEDWCRLTRSKLHKQIMEMQKKIIRERKKGNIDLVLQALKGYGN
nr:hypothetical protein [Nitrosopumilaceae archaeon]NIU01025.1 hypothetical protein [Nitrosopumilaceae archaeon]NIV65508.1 hypothetical protein [Nitrosopumilaceae archaeon]NIX61627.1 hypothetical protein [Nitrosopumilaceae archaeon]